MIERHVHRTFFVRMGEFGDKEFLGGRVIRGWVRRSRVCGGGLL